MRGARGYLILYRDADVRLAHALAYNKDDCPFPAGLLEYVEPVEVGDLGAVTLDDLDSADPQQIRLFQPQAPVLELVRKGRRNISLFDAVRFWAYRARKTTYDEWLRAVEIRTLAGEPALCRTAHRAPRQEHGVLHRGMDLDDVPRRLRSRFHDGATAAWVVRTRRGGRGTTTTSGTARLSGVGKPESL